TQLRMHIARTTLAERDSEGEQVRQQALAQWTARSQRLQAELARQIPEMNLEEWLAAVDGRVVAQALPEGAVLVEYVRFPVFDFESVAADGERRWQPARYLAFVLYAGDPDLVAMIDLGEAAPLDQLIADFRTGVTGEAELRNLTRQAPHP